MKIKKRTYITLLLGVCCQPFIFWGISHCCEFCSWVMPEISNIYLYVKNVRACEKVLRYRFSNPVPVIQIVGIVPTSMRKKNSKGEGGWGSCDTPLYLFLIFSHSLASCHTSLSEYQEQDRAFTAEVKPKEIPDCP